MPNAARDTAIQFSSDVARLVTDEVLSGHSIQDPSQFSTPITGLWIDLHGLQRLQEAAIARFSPSEKMECDAWLAPRLHCFLRLTRRHAHNQGLWRWLALVPMAPYVRYRWAEDGKVTADRFLGTGFSRRNAIARLWWSAESLRHGPDYQEVPFVLRNSALDQYILDLRYGYLRASALAIARVCSGRHAGVPQMTFNQIKTFSKRVNLLLSATSLESLAPPEADEFGFVDTEWLRTEPITEVIINQKLEDLRGPNDGNATEDEIQHFERWYAEIAIEAIGK